MKTRKDKSFSLEELSSHGWEIVDTQFLPEIFWRKVNKELETHYDGNKYKVLRIIKFVEYEQ